MSCLLVALAINRPFECEPTLVDEVDSAPQDNPTGEEEAFETEVNRCLNGNEGSLPRWGRGPGLKPQDRVVGRLGYRIWQARLFVRNLFSSTRYPFPSNRSPRSEKNALTLYQGTGSIMDTWQVIRIMNARNNPYGDRDAALFPSLCCWRLVRDDWMRRVA